MTIYLIEHGRVSESDHNWGDREYEIEPEHGYFETLEAAEEAAQELTLAEARSRYYIIMRTNQLDNLRAEDKIEQNRDAIAALEAAGVDPFEALRLRRPTVLPEFVEWLENHNGVGLDTYGPRAVEKAEER